MPVSFALSEIRHVLAQTPAALDALLRPLPDMLLDATEGPGTWSPKQVVAHLAWAEIDDWMPRVRRVLAGEAFTPFDREVGFARYAGWPIETLLDEFRALRATSLSELDSLGLQPDSFQRRGVHPEFGSVTLEQLLATWMTHDFAHLTQVSRVLTRHYGQWIGPWKAYFSALRPLNS
jgi:uncharacterized damage-inducible protein DinB